MTDPIPTVQQAWSAAMGDLTAIRKREVTSGGSRYNFRGVDTTMNAVGPVLRTHGLMVIPKVREAKHRDFASGQKNTTMHEAIVTVDYTIYGPAGDTMEGGSIGEASDASDKATAQAMSVAYRIFLLQSMTMPTDDTDPDMQHTDRAPIGQPAQQQRPPAQQQEPPAAKPEFNADEAKAAYTDLYGRTATVAEPAFSEINGWVERAGITDESITRQLARVWHDKITAAPKDSTAKPPSQRDAGGWKSDADRDQTWASLNERHDLAIKNYEPGQTPPDLDKPAKESFTRKEGEDWLEGILELELGAPF